jgi:hypothetical protein
MANEQLRRQLMENYLKQQQSADVADATSVTSENPNPLVLYNEVPENISLEEFKNFVKKWLEYDNFIKKAREIIKEKKKLRDKLSETITKFMCKYNIEDLNTKEGRIRCKTLTVKPPVSQKVVKQRITDYFKGDENRQKEIITKIYEDRETVEKVSLRRLKIT